MKSLFVIYVDFECLLRNIRGCEPDKSNTVKTEKHEVCGYSYIIVRSDGETYGLYVYRGEDSAYKFLVDILQKERWLRSLTADKKAAGDDTHRLVKTQNVTDCHICGKSLLKETFLDSISVHDHNTGPMFVCDVSDEGIQR